MTDHRTHLDYTCAGCGAQAVTVPPPPGEKGFRVTVPHGPGCPVAARVMDMRNRVYLRELAAAL